jgi:hypothetical protein
MSRVAAISALVLFSSERAYETFVRDRPLATAVVGLSAIFYIGFASGIRGTLAYHRYKRQPS